MPSSDVLNHRIDGPAAGPALLLGTSLGTSMALWEPQVPALARTHRVVRWDLPGHGGSPADLVGAKATVADLGKLVLALADSLGIERFSYAGVSIGGAIGAWLAVHHPDRIASLVMVCSSARFSTPEYWNDRIALVREKGIGAVADTAPDRWFAPGQGGDPFATALVDDLRATDPDGYLACCAALAVFDLREELPQIKAPTLVIAGRADGATPPADARVLVDGIPGASLMEISGAGHLATADRPGQVTAALLAHFAADSAAGARYAAGMKTRREVLGDEHVDRAISRTTDFTAPFQDFITRYAWGEIWSRPGLDRKTRSCVTLTALVAHGHLEELGMHVRAALRNGLTPEEISEVLLQTAVYCGVPAANAAFAVAARILAEG